MEFDRGACLAALGIAEADAPVLALLTDPWATHDGAPDQLRATGRLRPLAVPGMSLVEVTGKQVLHCTVYGATRAVEPVHVCGAIGTGTVVLVGTCAALQPTVRQGDVVIAQTATIGEGASQYYGGHATASADPQLSDRLAAALQERGLPAHRGRVVTTDALLGTSSRLVESWAGAGHLGLDLDTSAVLTAATYFGMRAACLLVVRHGPHSDAAWLDTLRAVDGTSDATAAVLVEAALSAALEGISR